MIAGWVAFLCTATVAGLPLWAGAWAAAERRLITLSGLPAITVRVPGWQAHGPCALTLTSLLAFTTLVPVLLAPVRSAERAPVGQTLDSE